MITSINHINLSATDLDETARFYERVFDLERIPSIDSNNRGVWFKLGNAQLHLTQREVDVPSAQHFAVNVDDFEKCYERLSELDALDWETFGSALFLLRDGTMQLYATDPSGNSIEIDCPDWTSLPEDIRRLASRRWELFDIDETEEGRQATLYL